LKGKLPSVNWERLRMVCFISFDTPAKKMEDFAALITRTPQKLEAIGGEC
jgi:hypothetical protein